MWMGNQTETKVIDRPSHWDAAREQICISGWENSGWELHKILPDRLYFKKPKITPKVESESKPYYGQRRWSDAWRCYQKWDGIQWVRDYSAGSRDYYTTPVIPSFNWRL